MMAGTLMASRALCIVEKNLFLNNVPIALHNFVGVQLF